MQIAIGRRIAPVLMVAAFGTAAAAAPPPPPTGPLAEWPCSPAAREALTTESVYGKPVAMPVQQADWQNDPKVRSLVDFIAAPENGPDQGAARIDAMAAQAGPEKRGALLLALQGMVERTNQLRTIIAYGVREKVEKSRLLAEMLTTARDAVTALPADAPAEQRRALEQDRSFKSHALGDNAEDAELLCHRLDYTARKAQRLAARIAEHIEPK